MGGGEMPKHTLTEEELARGRQLGAPLGGHAVAQHRGREYMRILGKRGYAATLERHGKAVFERGQRAAVNAAMHLEQMPDGQMAQRWSDHYLRDSGLLGGSST